MRAVCRLLLTPTTKGFSRAGRRGFKHSQLRDQPGTEAGRATGAGALPITSPQLDLFSISPTSSRLSSTQTSLHLSLASRRSRFEIRDSRSSKTPHEGQPLAAFVGWVTRSLSPRRARHLLLLPAGPGCIAARWSIGAASSIGTHRQAEKGRRRDGHAALLQRHGRLRPESLP